MLCGGGDSEEEQCGGGLVSLVQLGASSSIDCVLRKPPVDDGGTGIKHFIVELCDITTNNLWTSVAMTEDGDCLAQEVLHLREGHKYSFRVAAANRIGQSEPTEGEDVITKDPWGKPCLVRIYIELWSC